MVGASPAANQPQPLAASLKALDWANFFLADVRDGLGPYLAIYLLTSLHWQTGHGQEGSKPGDSGQDGAQLSCSFGPCDH